jgi:hypothetical protein
VIFLGLSRAAELQPPQEQTAPASVGEEAATRKLTSAQQTRLAPPKPRIRGVVFKLSSLFALDAFAGGLAVQTILAVWFRHRFGVSLGSLGLLFFGVNLLAALSFVAAPWLTKRFGLLKTMIVPHFISNVFLLLVPLMPMFPLAAVLLLLRQSLSKLDVPARQAYTIALVSPEERTAAASCTTVARSVAVSISPLLSGFLLSGPMLVLGLPILLASSIEMGYDATLWSMFRRVPLHPSHRGGRKSS